MEVKGRGVFPLGPIPAGEIIVKFEGPVFDKAKMTEEKDFSEAIQVCCLENRASRPVQGVFPPNTVSLSPHHPSLSLLLRWV